MLSSHRIDSERHIIQQSWVLISYNFKQHHISKKKGGLTSVQEQALREIFLEDKEKSITQTFFQKCSRQLVLFTAEMQIQC